MNTTNPQGAQSKVAQYITGQVKLNDLMNINRLSVPVQKRFKFEDTWITMNRTIGEAVFQRNPSELISVGQQAMATAAAVSGGRSSWDKSKKVTEIQQKRRNAIAVINQATREMTNGRSWPKMEDWLICPDQKIRYSQFIVPFREPNESEWLQKSVGGEIQNKDAEKVPGTAVTSTAAAAAETQPASVELPAVPTSVPELKLDFLTSSAKSEKQPENVENFSKPKVDVKPSDQKSAKKLESAGSVLISGIQSNYNIPGCRECLGLLPESDI